MSSTVRQYGFVAALLKPLDEAHAMLRSQL
jgi:hypothetical protein